MYKVFILDSSGFAHAEVRRNGEFLTSALGATNAQALREIRRQVRVARHAGEFASEYGPANPAPERWESDENGNSNEPARTVDDRGWILEDIRTSI